jgi:hypothetical protein
MYKRNEYKNKNINVNLIHTKFLKKYKKVYTNHLFILKICIIEIYY